MMATTYTHVAVVPRHKRKGTPMRSPCRRDMTDAPGVVFRFPDKISTPMQKATVKPQAPAASSIEATVTESSAMDLWPSAAGLPPLSDGAKATGAALLAAAASADPLSSQVEVSVKQPVVHKQSATNVLHYPELLSDLRDHLALIQQAMYPQVSGAESDAPESTPRPTERRVRARRTNKAAEGGKRTGLRGSSPASSSPAASSSSGSGAVRASGRSRSELSEHEAAAAVAELASMAAMHRRHSTGTILAHVDEDDEDVDIEGSDEHQPAVVLPAAKPAKQVKRKRESDERAASPAKRAHSGTSTGSGRRCCVSCGVKETPCWRPGWIDGMNLCNSCGLRYKKGKVYCASCCYVPMKTEIATGGAVVCKRCSASVQSAAHFRHV
ncbi:DNA-binding transcription repressor [Linderina macrospora]|uniref:DNA-binding transcription repressor n=1 Tax=Linderina macrospora TaxID=4868 RepID=A0ACC1JFZ4_9FUNG|nr:DNA-binding transcription repressor [Linderina macrospora]